MSPDTCSFVIPAYNEGKRLGATLDSIALLSSDHPWETEIVVIDDGSDDDTAEVARAFSAPGCCVSVHCFPHRGKGFAIRQGVSACHGEIIILCDADLRDSVDQVLPLIEALGHGADIAIGSRWLSLDDHRREPLSRRVSSRVFNFAVRQVLALRFKDTQCGLKALTREAADQVFKLLSLDGWGYDPEMIHVASALNLRIQEVALSLAHEYRDSHFRPITDGYAAFSELLKIRCNDSRGSYGTPTLGKAFSRAVLRCTSNAAPLLRRPAQQRSTPAVAVRRLMLPGRINLPTERSVIVFQVPADLTPIAHAAVLGCLRKLIDDEHHTRFVLDCCNLRMGSAPFDFLLCCLEEAMKCNGDLRLAALHPRVRTELVRVGIADVLRCFDSTEAAVQSFDIRRTATAQLTQFVAELIAENGLAA